MTKSIRFAFLVSISLIASVLLHSCCTEEWVITGSGELTIEGGRGEAGPVNSAFNLLNQFEADLVSEDLSEFSLINSALATSCEYSFRNNIDLSSLSLTLDQDFTLDDVVIDAGTNLLELTEFSVLLAPSFAGLFIQITPSFFTNADFSKGDHTFVLEGDIDDGLKIESSLTLEFDF